MKLALSSEKNAEILSVTGPIVAHDVNVLRAGIQKILKTGKNKIVLELVQSESVPAEVLRTIASIDLIARELSGRIVLAGITPGLRTRIDAFAQPPTILCFETRAQAIEFLTAPPKPEVGPEESKPAESELKLQADFSNLRERVAELERRNKLLEEQVVRTTIARRAPPNEAVYLAKIRNLEAKIQEFLATPPPTSPAPASAAAPKA
ncbi:MAG: hypothetical protein P4M08_02030 [Oligoflexia bacterium]|nr:hypothetical protein [Oligoflexia bacterium]